MCEIARQTHIETELRREEMLAAKAQAREGTDSEEVSDRPRRAKKESIGLSAHFKGCWVDVMRGHSEGA